MQDFARDGGIVAELLNRYLRESERAEKPVIQLPPIEKLADTLKIDQWISDGGLEGHALHDFLETYLEHTTRLHHPGYIAHQVARPNLQGALGCLVDGFTNNGMNIYEMGPPASVIEYVLVNWMLRKVGWQPRPWPRHLPSDQPHGGGLLTHGGSLANLTALTAARAHRFPDVWQKGYEVKPALLAPRTCHYSVSRAAGIMGMGTNAVFGAEVDPNEVLIPDSLPATYQRSIDQGYQPFAMVVTACATATGLYDPIDEAADFCEEVGLWLHVDGAHGASAILDPSTRHLMKGVERADSMIWDAHKMLSSPSLCAAVLVKNGTTLDVNFQQEASYLFHEKDQPGFDFISRTVECTKAALGLRCFLGLAQRGEAGAGEHVAKLYQKTRRFYEMIQAREGFSCPVAPQSNILCFRYGDACQDQLDLRKLLLREGDYYIASTLVSGKRYLRLTVMNPATTEDVIHGMLNRIVSLAENMG